MAHELDFTNDRTNFAYRTDGGIPWHSLGTPMDNNQPLEVWAQEAGMTWKAEEAPALYYDEVSDTVEVFEGRKIILRSDTRQPLSMVGSGFSIVQPMDVIDFFKRVLDLGGYQMETAGCLFGGKRFFASARIEQSLNLMGKDHIEGYLILATGVGGDFATTGLLSSVRPVCNNTLTAALNTGEGGTSTSPYIKLAHNIEFDQEWMLQQLGLVEGAWSRYADKVEALANRKVTDEEAMQWLVNVLGDPNKKMDEQPNQQAMAKVIQLFKGDGRGSNLESANGTAWGLVNAVTEFADHYRNTKSPDARFLSAQFGEWSKIKADAFDEAFKLAA